MQFPYFLETHIAVADYMLSSNTYQGLVWSPLKQPELRSFHAYQPFCGDFHKWSGYLLTDYTLLDFGLLWVFWIIRLLCCLFSFIKYPTYIRTEFLRGRTLIRLNRTAGYWHTQKPKFKEVCQKSTLAIRQETCYRPKFKLVLKDVSH